MSNSTAKNESWTVKAGIGSPIWPVTSLKKASVASGAMRKAMPSPGEHNGEGTIEKVKVQEKEDVVLVEGSRNRIGLA